LFQKRLPRAFSSARQKTNFAGGVVKWQHTTSENFENINKVRLKGGIMIEL
jgi:hypothetical protein